jgi:uncharacterized flavoprotein (TIGR03862 family)
MILTIGIVLGIIQSRFILTISMLKKNISIIGSGPSALMLAATLNEEVYDVTIYERNFAPGRKFLVAGEGGFNLTHSENMEQFINRYTPPDFLEKSLRSFTNTDFCNWLKKIKIETYTGSSKRIFPVKGIKPIEVLNAVLNELKRKKVQIKTQHTWKGWNEKGELLLNHNGEDLFVQADSIIFALGGASWSKTGSDGQWFELFKNKNIEALPFQPSNCAYKINWDAKFLEISEGQSLKNISVSCGDIEKKGELVITEFGLEGGAVYALSPEIRKQLNATKTAIIFIDLKPGFTQPEIQNKLSTKGNKSYAKLLKDGLNLSDTQLALLKTVLTKEDFINIEQLSCKIKKLPLTISAMGSIDEAISTVGGISLNEVDNTFQLIKIPNHYVIGEMLDWDAPTGGYLLQACFSMGFYLGENLNRKIK